MQVRNVLHVARWKYRTQKWCKKIGICAPLHNFVGLYLLFTTKACIDNRKKNLLNNNISPTSPHIMVNGPPLLRLVREFGALHQISAGFVTWLCYCSDVAHRRPTKLCTMFGRLLGWYTMYTFSGALAPWQNFVPCRIYFTSKSCILLYWQRYCMALQQQASAKLCSMVQGMELPNFRTGCHLYLSGRPSCLASAHILVYT